MNYVSSDLTLTNLSDIQLDLMSIENRRFMYHPDGWLILGAEGVCAQGGLFKSHAEEYYEVNKDSCLPSFDEFLRGWIGVGKPGKQYAHGIIHFAPNIPDGHIELFDEAFSFIEMSLKNGFSDKTVLRGFPGKWEQTVGEMFGKNQSLDEKIDEAKVVSCRRFPGKQSVFFEKEK